MASEEREEALVLCVELDFLTLASGVSRLQTQCPCQSGGRTPARQNVEWGVCCEVIRFFFFFVQLPLASLPLPVSRFPVEEEEEEKEARYILMVRAYLNIISERNTETQFSWENCWCL